MGSAIPVMLGGVGVSAIAGAAGAWWLHRRSSLSALNVYLLAAVCGAAFLGALATFEGALIAATGPLAAAGVAGAAVARRLRVAALGAGGELREFEQARAMLWTAIAPARRGRGRELRRQSARARRRRRRAARAARSAASRRRRPWRATSKPSADHRGREMQDGDDHRQHRDAGTETVFPTSTHPAYTENGQPPRSSDAAPRAQSDRGGRLTVVPRIAARGAAGAAWMRGCRVWRWRVVDGRCRAGRPRPAGPGSGLGRSSGCRRGGSVVVQLAGDTELGWLACCRHLSRRCPTAYAV